MAATGLGQDGYIRVQKETTYGTGVTSSMTLWPVKEGSLLTAQVQNIENENTISSRLKQAPSPGRKACAGSVMIDMHPSLLGQIFNFMLGAATTAGPSDSTYTHTWLIPTTGERIATSFTLQQALGGDLADTFKGAKITGLKLSSDNSGNISAELTVLAQDYTEGVARISSFSYPAYIPYNFSMAAITIDPLSPTNDASFSQVCDSFELSIELGYEEERFKTGSRTINNPVFKTIPSISLSMEVDAEKKFVDYARLQELFDITITITSTENAAGTTPFSTVIELPGARLSPETSIPGDKDRLMMSLEFDCGYGGTTTGSSGANVMGEIRQVDATTSYTA